MIGEIEALATALVSSGEKIRSLAQLADKTDSVKVADILSEQAIDELRHVQILTLALTERLAPVSEAEGHIDEGETAFGPGELDNHVKGKEATEEEGGETR